MFYWLLIAILAYLFLGFSSLGDKLILATKNKETAKFVLKPQTYTFYIGILSLFVIIFIPFIKFGFPSSVGLMWIVLDAFVHLVGIYTMYVAIENFDVSKVIATIGATQPIFIFVLTWIFWGHQVMPLIYILAFALLFIGSIIISLEKNIKITKDYLKITIFSSVMFSLDYLFAKLVFINQSFLPGIIWMQIFMFLFVLSFLFNRNFRKEIFGKKVIFNKRIKIIFFSTQVCGGLANLLQSFAISLAPVIFLATVNSLRGTQYVFLFIATLFLSHFYPKILKEELSKKIIIQKIISIIFIAFGLAILAIY